MAAVYMMGADLIFCAIGSLMTPWSSHWPRALVHMLLPSSCALCGAGCPGVVCAPCRDQFCLPLTNRCARCANPLSAAGTSGTCSGCLAYPPSYEATVAAADYAPPLDHLVLQLKFGARLPLAPWFAEMLRDAVLARPGLPLPELLCPVPLGPARLVERGYNQALEIARPLSRLLGTALYPRLALRQLDPRAQSGVSPHERAENIRGAFAIAEPGLIEGRHIGIVDDVMTSGHTLEELAATFKRFGAARVTNLVFARTPPRRPSL
jgi:ComF family protein